MFQEVWNLIQKQDPEAASRQLDQLVIKDDYSIHMAKILRAEIALQRQDYLQSIEFGNEAFDFFLKRVRTIDELYQDSTGLGIGFLENCLLYWIYARALAGQKRWPEALEWTKNALKQWEFYRIGRRPFLKFRELSQQWDSLPSQIRSHLDLLYQMTQSKPSREELLELIVSDDFNPALANFTPKTNDLGPNPFVTVCIAAYQEGDWLKTTVDAIFENAGYDNYELILVYQKKHSNDSIDSFLESPFYTNHPKLKLVVFDQPLGADHAKQIGYDQGSGELLISLDAHVIPCHDFIKKTVDLFLANSEISLLGYGVVATYLDRSLHHFFFNEVSHWIDGIMVPCHIIYGSPESMIPYKPGLYKRQTFIGAAFCITRQLFTKLGGYLLKDRSWGDKSLAMNAYLYGYYAFAHSDLICIHKWHSNPPLTNNPWKETNPEIFALEDIPGSALTIGYFYFSKKYFENYFLPWIKQLAGETFDFHWQRFQEKLPELTERKKVFWKHAERSLREYWLEFGDYIWNHLPPEERTSLFPYVTPPKDLS